jgi:Lipocalin-like domain
LSKLDRGTKLKSSLGDAVKKSVLFATLCLGLGLLSGNAAAQQAELKRQLVGTWTFVSTSGKLPDGSPTWGADPKGLLIFTDNGYYASLIVRADVPKFAAKNRLQGTAEENKAAVHGGIGTFGTYTVDEDKKAFTVSFTASTYPNNTGTEQTRPFTISGDELKIVNPASSAGGQSELLYKRAK